MRIFATVILLGALVACSKPEAPAPQTSAEAQQPTGLERIPDPDPAKYPKFHDLAQWRNPQLVVREDGIGLVDLENHEVHILKPEQVPAELVSLPETAWPYGRVVLVSQTAPKDNSEQTKARLREIRGLLMGTLKELQVQAHEAP
ncbi:MAG: hypothetical protein WAQ52_15465 [Terriglobales bacterium]